MIRLVRGALLTLRYMGFSAFLREASRRFLGIKYSYCGIPIDSTHTFRVIRNIISRGYGIHVSSDGVVVRTPFGEFCVNVADVDLLAVLSEPIEDMYGFVDVRNSVVVDIGVYIHHASEGTVLVKLNRVAELIKHTDL